jgi:queuine tRNA-ribosyltransferase
MLAAVLLSWHNIAFYQQLMSGLRLACEAGKTQPFAREFLSRYRSKSDLII